MSHQSRLLSSIECPLASLGHNSMPSSDQQHTYCHPLSSSPLNPGVYQSRTSPLLKINANGIVQYASTLSHADHDESIQSLDDASSIDQPQKSQSQQSNDDDIDDDDDDNVQYVNCNGNYPNKLPCFTKSIDATTMPTSTKLKMHEKPVKKLQRNKNEKSSKTRNDYTIDCNSSNSESSNQSSADEQRRLRQRQLCHDKSKQQQQHRRLVQHQQNQQQQCDDERARRCRQHVEQYFLEDKIQSFMQDNENYKNMLDYGVTNDDNCFFIEQNFNNATTMTESSSSQFHGETSESERNSFERSPMPLSLVRSPNHNYFAINNHHMRQLHPPSSHTFCGNKFRDVIERFSPSLDQGYATLLSPTPSVANSSGGCSGNGMPISNTVRRTETAFNKLSNEICWKIFDWLDASDLCKLSKVCKRFNVLVWQPQLWQKISLKGKERRKNEEKSMNDESN